MFDVEFGELVGIAEVELLTGISKSQLRNWRKPEFAHLAKFDEYHGAGNKVWYRLADVEQYLADAGVVVGGSGFRRVERPNAVRSAVVVEFLSDDKRVALGQLAEITTETMWLRWSVRMSEMLGAEYPKRLRAEQARLYALYKGVGVDQVESFVAFGGKREHPEQFFVGNVLAYRRMLADVRGWNVDDVELLGLPLGDVPPLKEVK